MEFVNVDWNSKVSLRKASGEWFFRLSGSAVFSSATEDPPIIHIDWMKIGGLSCRKSPEKSCWAPIVALNSAWMLRTGMDLPEAQKWHGTTIFWGPWLGYPNKCVAFLLRKAMINHEILGVFRQPDLCIPETHRSDACHSNPFSGTASFSCGFTYVVFSFYGRTVVKLGSHLTFLSLWSSECPQLVASSADATAFWSDGRESRWSAVSQRVWAGSDGITGVT